MKPFLSIVVVSHGPNPWLGDCLRSLSRETTAVPYEVIVVLNPETRQRIGLDDDPGVRWIGLPRRANPGEARNAGWRAASGEIVAFLLANCTVLPGWIDARIEEHENRPDHVIGGPVRIATGGRALPTAAYFCELATWFPSRPEGYVDNWPICSLSYPRAVLEAAGGFSDEPGFSDIDFHRNLRVSRGIRIWVSPQPAIEFHPIDRLSEFLGHRFRQGRIYADLRATREGLSAATRTVRALAWWLLPWVLFMRGLRAVGEKAETRRDYLRCAPLIFLGWTAHALGDAVGLLAGGEKPRLEKAA